MICVYRCTCLWGEKRSGVLLCQCLPQSLRLGTCSFRFQLGWQPASSSNPPVSTLLQHSGNRCADTSWATIIFSHGCWGSELRSSRLLGKCSYPLHHLCSSVFSPFTSPLCMWTHWYSTLLNPPDPHTTQCGETNISYNSNSIKLLRAWKHTSNQLSPTNTAPIIRKQYN